MTQFDVYKLHVGICITFSNIESKFFNYRTKFGNCKLAKFNAAIEVVETTANLKWATHETLFVSNETEIYIKQKRKQNMYENNITMTTDIYMYMYSTELFIFQQHMM